MLTMAPPPDARIAGISNFMLMKTLVRFVLITACQLSSGMSATAKNGSPAMPALLTAPSSRPKRSTVLATMASTSARTVTSARMKRPSPPAAFICASTASPCASRRPVMATLAPWEAREIAAVAPRPEVPPVIRITLFWNWLMCGSSFQMIGKLDPGAEAVVVFGQRGEVVDEAEGFEGLGEVGEGLAPPHALADLFGG